MRVQLTFKTPDVLREAIEQTDKQGNLADFLHVARKFIKYDEYITVDLDLKAQTCTVVPL